MLSDPQKQPQIQGNRTILGKSCTPKQQISPLQHLHQFRTIKKARKIPGFLVAESTGLEPVHRYSR